MDLQLSDEQRAIQETVREFVDRRVLPVAQENDINHHLDMGIIEGMAELGLLGAPIPAEYGGAGLDYVCEALICEEIERGESAFRTLISVHVGLNSLSLLRYGSEEQKRTYLEPMAKGEKLGCFGLTEPAAGSDVAAMLTTAIRQPDGTYLLNGQKNWISYATEADYELVFAKTDPAAAHRGISAFIVERAWEGVEARQIPNKLGIWAGSTGELFFYERAGAGRKPGRRGGRRLQDRHALARPRPLHRRRRRRRRDPRLPGGVRQVRQRARDVRQAHRRAPVRPGLDRQMVLDYETSRLLVMQAAAPRTGRAQHARDVAGQVARDRGAFKAANLAIQVHGAYGYSAEYPLERFFRNARAPIIYEGTTQIHKMMQAEHALGYRMMNG